MKVRRSVGERGQVTLPKDIREELGILPDSDVLFSVEDGRVVIEGGSESFVKFAEELSGEIGRLGKTIDDYRDEQVRKRL
ncbi:MAG: AbrB/MazE/SpoVT family DNA-binding domain-containing protein [Candidatus Nanohalobium sp.]